MKSQSSSSRATESAPSLSHLIIPKGTLGAIVVCEHASWQLPVGVSLGISEELRQKHIGYDIGARWAAGAFARSLNGILMLARYSRLFVDLNRRADDPAVIPEISDNIVIPANQHLTPEQRAARIAAYHTPFHHRLLACAQRYPTLPVITIHSFTPALMRQPEFFRGWDCSLVYDTVGVHPDSLIFLQAYLDTLRSEPMAAKLGRGERAIPKVGDNVPYTGVTYGYTTRALQQERLAFGIEIRQDLISQRPQAQGWGRHMAEVFHACLPALSSRMPPSPVPSSPVLSSPEPSSPDKTIPDRVEVEPTE